jgi:hypothetical protein
MKSNDSIPADEMLLAEALAAAMARELKFLDSGMFATGDNVHNEPRKTIDRCCAYGALVLAGRAPEDFLNAPPHLENVGMGNDSWEEWSLNGDHGESLGYAYRCAMESE